MGVKGLFSECTVLWEEFKASPNGLRSFSLKVYFYSSSFSVVFSSLTSDVSHAHAKLGYFWVILRLVWAVKRTCYCRRREAQKILKSVWTILGEINSKKKRNFQWKKTFSRKQFKPPKWRFFRFTLKRLEARRIFEVVSRNHLGGDQIKKNKKPAQNHGWEREGIICLRSIPTWEYFPFSVLSFDGWRESVAFPRIKLRQNRR